MNQYYENTNFRHIQSEVIILQNLFLKYMIIEVGEIAYKYRIHVVKVNKKSSLV